MSREYYISLGSNLGDRGAFLRSGVRAMERAHLVVTARSAMYETLPWGRMDQPLFLNAVVSALWDGTPEVLLQVLLDIEQSHERRRDLHWGPRTLDLDLIYSEGVCRNTDFLRLPHPLFWDRAFVLVPLADIAPDLVYRGESIVTRIAALHGWDAVKKSGETWEKDDHGGT